MGCWNKFSPKIVSKYLHDFKNLNLLPENITNEEANQVAMAVAKALADDDLALSRDDYERALEYTDRYQGDWLPYLSGTELSDPKYLPVFVAMYRSYSDWRIGRGTHKIKWIKSIARKGIDLTGDFWTDFRTLATSFGHSREGKLIGYGQYK